MSKYFAAVVKFLEHFGGDTDVVQALGETPFLHCNYTQEHWTAISI